MKKYSLSFLVLLLGAGPLVALTEPGNLQAGAEARVHVAKFQGNRSAALTYTFDDGLRDQYTQAAPMLDEFGFHGTFFIIGKYVAETVAEAAAKKPGAHGGVSWSELRDLALRGHEIGNHSWTHRQLVKCTDEELAEEIDRNRTVIYEKLGFVPLTFCYPGNGSNAKVRAAVLENHIAARERHFEIGQTSLTAADANAWTDDTIAKGSWGIAMIHGISAGYHALSSPDVLREHLAYVKAHEDKIWVDTFANVASYVAERNSAKLVVRALDAQSAIVVLNADPVYPPHPVPLTLVIVARGATTATAERDGQALATEVRAGQVLVNAVPSPDEIQVKWQ